VSSEYGYSVVITDNSAERYRVDNMHYLYATGKWHPHLAVIDLSWVLAAECQ